MTAEELLRRYAAGERDFTAANLSKSRPERRRREYLVSTGAGLYALYVLLGEAEFLGDFGFGNAQL